MTENDSQRLERIKSKTSLTVADIQEIARIRTGLWCLLVFSRGCTFAPGALRCLAKARQWKYLCFNASKLRPADLEDLGTLGHVMGLGFTDCPIGNADLHRLGVMPKLTRLWLERTKITNAGLACLSQFPALEWLALDDTSISDSGLKHLVGLDCLTDLTLSGTKVTDKGLQHLTALRNLHMLWLDRTFVTNEGILQLAGLPKLTFNAALGSTTKVTKKGIEAFHKAQIQAAREAKGKRSDVVNEPDPKEVDAAKRSLYAFFEAMNAWEKECQRIDASSTARRMAQQRKAVREIFRKHRTKKKRAYETPNVLTWQSPPTYAGYRRVKILDVEQPSRRKMLFFMDEWCYIRYQFVMVKRGDHWLLDHKKWFMNNGWEPTLL